MKDIGSIIADVEGVVIKTFLIGAPKPLPFPVFPKVTRFIFRRGCHTQPSWLPPLF